MEIAIPYLDGVFLFRPPAGVFAAVLVAFAVIAALGLLYAVPFSSSRGGGKGFMVILATHAAGGVLAVLAQDLLSLLVAWEMLAFSAFFAVGGNGNRAGSRVAHEYVAYQIVAAGAFFVGAAVHYRYTGSLSIEIVHPAAQPFLLGAVAIKAAAVPVHLWLVNAYPRAPVGAAPLLSVYATKVGLYTAARLLSVPVLPWIGAFMAVAGVAGALMQRSARRLLSYHIVSQLGFMFAGVGLATAAGITAGLFHAVNNMIYKALLFMVVGAVIYRTGRERIDDLGGLAGAMPITFAVGVVASASIAGMPPLAGFASKELIKTAIGHGPVTTALTVATVGTGLSFLKLMYAIFIRRPDRPYGNPPSEAPPAMLLPMGLLGTMCFVNGLFPALVVGNLPTEIYTARTVVAGLFPLAGSVLLWLAFHRRLLGGRQTSPLQARVQRYTGTIVSHARSALLLLHRANPQLYLAVVLAVWIVVVLLLGLPKV